MKLIVSKKSDDVTPFSYRTDPAVPAFADHHPIILFDGVCALCSAWVQFVLRHDKAEVYRFIPAQTPLGRALYVHFGLDPEDYQTNILLKDGVAFFKSEGSIQMAEGLGAPWSFAAIFRLLPLPVRDWLYERVARNRFRWFGRRATCYMPQPRFAARFLA